MLKIICKVLDIAHEFHRFYRETTNWGFHVFVTKQCVLTFDILFFLQIWVRSRFGGKIQEQIATSIAQIAVGIDCAQFLF